MTWPRKENHPFSYHVDTVENQLFSKNMQSLAIVFLANELITRISGSFFKFFI